jgi:hypothetical protein
MAATSISGSAAMPLVVTIEPPRWWIRDASLTLRMAVVLPGRAYHFFAKANRREIHIHV